jgi:transcriptional regulator with XRE-family HTH domain
MEGKPVPKLDGPNVRQRRVARRLRQWRTAKDMTLDGVGRKLKWSESKLSRFERAEVNAGPAEIIALATIYGIDEVIRDDTVRLAVDALENEDRWGKYGPDSLLRGDFKDFVEDEAEAAEIRNVETVLVSGLLQTARYAEALLRTAEDVTDEAVAARRELRQQRQARLDDQENPLHLHAILYEPALHLPIGGPEVMHEQLDHLLARAKSPNVTVQVLPSSAGAFPGIGTSYHLVNFDRDETGAVYLENLNFGLYIEDEGDLMAYTLNFERLRGIALNPKRSAQRITEIKKAWT